MSIALKNDRMNLGGWSKHQRHDRRWIGAGLWVGGLTLAGIVFSFLTSPYSDLSFSARVSFVYAPVAMAAILVLGWSRFDLAAAIFFGYLGLAKASAATFYLLGDINAAVTFEEVLAIPLVLTGLFGRPAHATMPSKRQPVWLTVSIAMIGISAVLSTLFAVSPSVAVATLFSRFVVPLLVILAAARRLHGIGDYKTVWFGFTVGLLTILVYDFQRAVLGVGADGISQRFVGLDMTLAVPCLLVAGGALWQAIASFQARETWRGEAWILLVAVMGLLIWLSAARGVFVGFSALIVWWLMTQPFRRMLSPRLLLFHAVGGLAVFGVIAYSLSRTHLDTAMVVRRLADLEESGIAGSNRWPIWVEAIGYWAKWPVFGAGLNNWVVLNDTKASCHGSVVGILLDMGLFGAIGFAMFFVTVLGMGSAKNLAHLNFEDRQFFRGCRAGWIVMMLVLSMLLPFTSGQPTLNIFSYVVFFYPLLVMVVYGRCPIRERPNGRPAHP